MRAFKKLTINYLRDLHARETMRLAWYRQWGTGGDKIKHLRERKAQHQAFLNDLLRKRGLKPAWYSAIFGWMGFWFGWFTAFLPVKWAQSIENTLEFWLMLRYEKYLKKLEIKFNLRSMIEAVQLKKMVHQEPGPDVLHLLSRFLDEQQDKTPTIQV